uniref:HDC10774 n=1 Tax=Drosophila melanogaster TaxID=7227 RepID=Q6IL16_DROME|nr:TPA_inf: HDC10774 [Drosophila melanogaster]
MQTEKCGKVKLPRCCQDMGSRSLPRRNWLGARRQRSDFASPKRAPVIPPAHLPTCAKVSQLY